MSVRLIAVTAGLLAGALGACGASSEHSGTSSAASSGKGASCQPRGTHTVAANHQARIFTSTGTVYGCAERTRKRFRLGHSGSCVGTDSAGPVTLAGELAGYGSERCGIDTGSSQVVVRRLSDGKTMLSDPATTTPLGPESYISIGSIVLRSNGSLAWVAEGGSVVTHRQIREVRKANRAGQVLLDSSAAINSGSLRLHGSQLTWKHGSGMRSAQLD